jgi:aminoglycoside/choline kinase family phosphotransferase
MDDELKRFYEVFLESERLTSEGVGIEPMAGDGSKRLFWRISIPSQGPSFVMVVSPPTEKTALLENNAYLMIGKHLKKKGIPVPEILKHDHERGLFIVEDMGRENLQGIALKAEDPVPQYEIVVEELIRMQVEGVEGFNTSWCCQTKRYDKGVMLNLEARYFNDAFLGRYLGLGKKWGELESAFYHLANEASAAKDSFFLHRDFQSRNIMIKDGAVGIVDWQGGRLGPLGYDLASLIIDPYVNLNLSQREQIFEAYASLLRNHDPGWSDSLRRYYPYLAIQRNLQILGAFSYLTKAMKKPQFQRYIPKALDNLDNLLDEMRDPKLSSLRSLVKDLTRGGLLPGN